MKESEIEINLLFVASFNLYMHICIERYKQQTSNVHTKKKAGFP